MPRVRINFSPLPSAAYSREIEIAEVGRPGTATILVSNTRDNPIIARVPDDAPSVLTVWVLESGARLAGSSSSYTYYPSTTPPAADAALATPEAPAVSQDGPALTVTPVVSKPSVLISLDTPKAKATPAKTEVAARPVDVDVRVSAVAVTDAADAVHVDTVRAQEHEVPNLEIPAPVIPGATEQKVWTRLRNPDNGQVTPWSSRTVVVGDPSEFAKIEDFVDSWGSVTIEQHYGLAPLAQVGSELVATEVPSVFAADTNNGFPQSIFGMSSGIAWMSMDFAFPYGRFETPEVNAGALHEFQPQLFPQVDAINRITERSIFAEHYPLFRQSRDVDAAQQVAGVGVLPVTGDSEDIHMFGTVSDRSPIRVVSEVKVTKDGVEAYRDYQRVRPGDRVLAHKYTMRHTLVSHRGLRAPKLRKMFCWRRIRNKKWEYLVPIDVSNGDKTFVFSPVPVAVGGNLTATITIENVATGGDINYETRIVSLSPTQIRFIVTQATRGTVPIIGGAGAYNFPAAFGAVPHIVCSPADATQTLFSGFHTATTTNCIIYATSHAGVAGNVDVDVVAKGPPAASAVTAHIILTGY